MKILTLCALSSAFLVLSGCNQRQDGTAGQQVDRAIASSKNAAKDIGQTAREKQRAERLAMNQKGVSSVDNKLAVEARQ